MTGTSHGNVFDYFNTLSAVLDWWFSSKLPPALQVPTEVQEDKQGCLHQDLYIPEQAYMVPYGGPDILLSLQRRLQDLQDSPEEPLCNQRLCRKSDHPCHSLQHHHHTRRGLAPGAAASRGVPLTNLQV